MAPSDDPSPRASDIGKTEADEHDYDDDVRQCLHEFGGYSPALQPDLRGVEKAEQRGAQRGARGRAAAKIERRQRDETAPAGDSLVEQADYPDRKMRPGETCHRARENRRSVANVQRLQAYRPHRRLRRAGRPQPEANPRAMKNEGGHGNQNPGEPGQTVLPGN